MARTPRTLKETHTIKLKAVFSSPDGKSSEEDAEQFKSQIEELIRKFKPKSDFKHNIVTERVTYKRST